MKNEEFFEKWCVVFTNSYGKKVIRRFTNIVGPFDSKREARNYLARVRNKQDFQDFVKQGGSAHVGPLMRTEDM